MEQFSNRAFLKWSNSQMEQFSNAAFWGRHLMPYFKIPRTEKYGMQCAIFHHHGQIYIFQTSSPNVATRSLSSILRDKNLGTFHVLGDVGWWDKALQGTSCLSGGMADMMRMIMLVMRRTNMMFQKAEVDGDLYIISNLFHHKIKHVSVTTGPTMPAMLKVCEILTADVIANT